MSAPAKTILLADDDVSIRALVRATLEGPGYFMLEASDGVEALRLSREESPDLIILDWKMPRMEGIDVVRALRLDASTKHIPIMLLTFRASEADFEAARAMGINAYLVKPFSPMELIEEVAALLTGPGRP